MAVTTQTVIMQVVNLAPPGN